MWTAADNININVKIHLLNLRKFKWDEMGFIIDRIKCTLSL